MQDDAKKRVALAALDELPVAGVIGLGTGSTARHFVDALAVLVRGGRRFVGVCTSEATRAQAERLGIPLLDDDGPWCIDVAIDGADEVDDALDLSKGAGGALTREKIVSFAARRTVIVCDASKRVHRLGETRPIAVEIVPFGHETTMLHLSRLGHATLRMRGGSLVRSDGSNLLADIACGPLADAGEFDRTLRSIPGVVETGIFIDRASVVLVAYDDRIERLAR